MDGISIYLYDNDVVRMFPWLKEDTVALNHVINDITL